ncbi:hypothetical protein HYDPIDRAFT_31274 [Hydnomerulius pinastri MD-312]|uniref:Uncharacterized protein n=1 Tax=Hydnomerulius pinastri MD-312 TaxID=994086 RepID=A0A0C9W4J4_9AGAM|nr:hypothetical protein HYDPIDRAFT_31274 [Hydnomerulius pinastri MD-312]
MLGQELVTQFTEDACAQEDRPCGRTVCQVLIRKGEPCFYVAPNNPTLPGREVCVACYEYYKKKLATTMWPRNTQGLPDPQSIRQSVNAAQSRASINPPPVVAIVPGPASGLRQMAAAMPPPVRLMQRQHFSVHPPPPSSQQPNVAMLRPGGPDVYVPSAWNRQPPRSQPSTSPLAAPSHLPLPPAAVGYGAQHALYVSERERWSRLAYCPPPAETISLDITAVYEGGPKKGRQRGTPFGNICEGRKDIDARSTAPELAAIALSTVLPQIEAFGAQFVWRPSEFVVRDVGWVDLDRHPEPLQPYFYKECLHPSSRKNSKTPVFKSKQFSLFVVVPDSQWQEYEDFQDKLESTAIEIAGATSTPLVASATSTPLVASARTMATQMQPTRLFLASEARAHPSQGRGTSGMSSFSSSMFDRPLSNDISGAVPHNASDIISAKRHHRHSSSVSSASAKSPPSKKHAGAPNPCSPDRQNLKEALKSGGATDLDVAAGMISNFSVQTV